MKNIIVNSKDAFLQLKNKKLIGASERQAVQFYSEIMNQAEEMLNILGEKMESGMRLTPAEDKILAILIS